MRVIGVCAAFFLAGCIGDIPGIGGDLSGHNALSDGITLGALTAMHEVGENARAAGASSDPTDTPVRPPEPLPAEDADFVCRVDGEMELVQAYDLPSARRMACAGSERCRCEVRYD